MQKFLRGFLFVLILLLGVNLVAAEAPNTSDYSSKDGFYLQQEQSDSASVRVIPDDAQIGEGLTILVSDINPNEAVTVRIILTDTDTQVYETERTADDRGRLEVEIYTESSDTPGNYRVEVLNADNDVIGSADFTLEAASGRNGSLTVTPTEGEAGTSFTIDISDVQAFADLLILITNEAGDEVYRTGVRATVDGTASVPFNSTPEAVGTLTIQVLQNERFPVATGTVVVQAETFPVTAELDPNPAMPGDEVFVTVSGLEADATATVVISNETGTILTQEVTANVSGLAIFSFTATPEMALGTYTVEVLQGETVLSRAEWLLDIPAPVVTVTPTVGVLSSNFLVQIAGLQPDEAVVVELKQGETVLQSFTVIGDAEGNARAVLGPRLDLAEGNYTVSVQRGGENVFNQDVSIVAEREVPETTEINPADVTLTVTPASGPIPTTYEIRAEGLPASTDFTLAIVYDGEAVYTTQLTSDENGVLVTGVNSEATDPVGDYSLELRYNGEVIASADFAISEAEPELEATEEPEVQSPETPGTDVSVRVEPQAVPQGERFEIYVNNLAAGETVTVELRLNGEAIYTSEQTADAAGALALGLRTESTDELGEYEVVVLRAGEEIASTSFEILASDAVVDTPELSISPESAPQGSSHTITVTGLEADETVNLSVSFEGDEVYSAERAANAQGVVTFVLNTSTEDAAGDYEVTLTYGDNELTGTFTVTEGDSSNLPDLPDTNSDLAITVDPSSGVIGTVHTITVTGLDANEAVSARVEFAGEVVYETSGAANEEGVYTLTIVTEEGDAAGSYTVTVERENGEEVSASFITEGGEVTTPDANFELTVEPSEVVANENFEVRATGLEAGETVAVIVFHDGEIVYQTSRQADDNGELLLNLAVEETDPTGTYTVEVSRNNDEIATADFEVLSGEGNDGGTDSGTGDNNGEDNTDGQNTDTTGGAITLGDESYTGELTANEPEMRFTFEGSEGQGVEIELRSEDFDSYLTLLNADGAEIAYNDDGAGGLDSRIVTTLPDDGEYTIVVSSFDNIIGSEPGIGRFTLTARAVEIAASTIELDSANQSVTDSLSPERPQVSFVFEGEAGSTILLSAESSEIDTYLTLLDENGNEIAYNDDSNGTLNSQIGPIQLPADGQYTAVVSSYGYINYGEASTGEFSFRLETVELTEASYGQDIELELNAETASYFIEFEGSAGDVIAVQVDSGESVDTTLTLLDSSGYTLISDDDGGAGFDPEIERLVLPNDGNYMLVLRAFSPGDSGTVQLTVNQLDQSSLDDGEHTVRLNSKQGSDILVFDGVAGETVDLVLTLEAGSVASFTVTAQQGDYSLLSYQSYGMGDSITLSFRVPENGLVQVSVQDSSGSNVILNVELVRD